MAKLKTEKIYLNIQGFSGYIQPPFTVHNFGNTLQALFISDSS